MPNGRWFLSTGTALVTSNLDAISVSDEALTFCNMILAQFGYVPALTPAVPGPARHPLRVPALPI
jgi:hypothetical protein